MTDPNMRSLWLAVVALAAVFVAVAAGLLSLANGAAPPGAALTGGGAFAATLLLVMAVIRFVTRGE